MAPAIVLTLRSRLPPWGLRKCRAMSPRPTTGLLALGVRPLSFGPRPLALGTLLLALAVPAAAPAASPPQWHGVPVALGPNAAAELDQAKALGATDVERFSQWSTIEAAGPGNLNPSALGRLDAAVRGAADRGLKVILRVRGTPCWT